MITNLVFKRVNNNVNPPRTELKIVEVNIPEINSGEGWVLSTAGEVVTVTKLLPKEPEPPISENSDVKLIQIERGDSFTSDVPGTARLVRKDDKILIGYRKGKSAAVRDQTNRNSVCIGDITKVEFFNACKSAHGRNTKDWFLVPGDNGYIEWNNFIDKEYDIQFTRVNKALYDEYQTALAAKKNENSIENT